MNVTHPLNQPDSGARSLLLFLLLNALGVSLAAISGLLLYIPIVLLALTTAVLLSRRLDYWLGFVVLGHLVLFFQRTTDISISEVIFGFVFLAYLGFYFVDRLVVKRESLLTGPGDNPLALFFLLAILSLVPAIIFENDLGLWGRELLVLIGLALYFPLRESFRTRGGRRTVLISFGLLALAVAGRNLLQYRERLDVVRFAWELVSGRQTANEPLFMAMVIGAGAFLGVSKNIRVQALSLALFGVFSVSLLVTFSRGYWVGTLIGLFILVLLLEKGERIRMLGVLSSVLLGGIGFSWLILGDRFDAVTDIVVRRLLSAGYALRDVSFLARLEESQVVFGHIVRNPVMGYGLGAEFGYYNALRDVTYVNAYIHNAYLWLWFKLGAAGLLSFLIAYTVKIASGVRVVRVAGEDRALVMSAVALLSTMLVISLTSPQFYARDSVLVIVLSWAVLARSAEGNRKAS